MVKDEALVGLVTTKEIAELERLMYPGGAPVGRLRDICDW